MNCGDCLEKLGGYMDRELSDSEVDEVRRHLADCPPCEDLYDFQVGMKRLVRVCCDRAKAPAHLRDRLNQILF
jgi:mycothiol system anti-sigma-R factor